MVSALDLVDDAIADLQARLNLNPSATKTNAAAAAAATKGPKKEKKGAKKDGNGNTNNNNPTNDEDQPDICKLEFKVGVITKVWNHETADKLYCEEIDVGEAEPRQIASGLRPHFTLEQMQGQRLLVVVSTIYCIIHCILRAVTYFILFNVCLCHNLTTVQPKGQKIGWLQITRNGPLCGSKEGGIGRGAGRVCRTTAGCNHWRSGHL